MSQTPEPPPIKTDSLEVWPLILDDLRKGLLVDPANTGSTQPLIDACAVAVLCVRNLELVGEE